MSSSWSACSTIRLMSGLEDTLAFKRPTTTAEHFEHMNFGWFSNTTTTWGFFSDIGEIITLKING